MFVLLDNISCVGSETRSIDRSSEYYWRVSLGGLYGTPHVVGCPVYNPHGTVGLAVTRDNRPDASISPFQLISFSVSSLSFRRSFSGFFIKTLTFGKCCYHGNSVIVLVFFSWVLVPACFLSYLFVKVVEMESSWDGMRR